MWLGVEDRDHRDRQQIIDDWPDVNMNVRKADGRWVEMTASTATANAMSVAVGIAHPAEAPCPT